MVNCCVLGCKSRSERKYDDITFHTFPKDNLHTSKWVAATGLKNNWHPTKFTRICSKHFEASCFRRTTHKVHINKSAVPTLFIHNNPSVDENVDESESMPSTSTQDNVTSRKCSTSQKSVDWKRQCVDKFPVPQSATNVS